MGFVGDIFNWMMDGDAGVIAREIKMEYAERCPGCSVVVEDGDYATRAKVFAADGALLDTLYSAGGRGLVSAARSINRRAWAGKA